MSKIARSSFLGSRWGKFSRVGLAFELYGYQPPQPDVEGGTGAYVSNIVNQYRGALSENEVMSIIEFGLAKTYRQLLHLKEYPDQLMNLKQLTDNYVERSLLSE